MNPINIFIILKKIINSVILLYYSRFIAVPPVLIKRLKQHFVTLPCNVDIILGTNGYIWVTIPSSSVRKREEGAGSRLVTVEETEAAKREHTNTVIKPDDRERIARVSNAVSALSAHFISISPDTIMDVYESSIELGLPARVRFNIGTLLCSLLHYICIYDYVPSHTYS